MKIFAYVGSYQKENSICMKITKRIIENLKRSDLDITDVIIRTPINTKIEDCTGCTQCYFDGLCSIKDDFVEVKQEMIKSDIILFSTPVFAHNVPGNFKTFLDRLTHWLRIMRLSGRRGIPIIIMPKDGEYAVAHYLERMMEDLGLTIVTTVKIAKDSMTKEDIERMIDIRSSNIIGYIKSRNAPVDKISKW